MKGVYPSTFLSVRSEERGEGGSVRTNPSCPRHRETTEGADMEEERGGGGGEEESLSPSSLPHGPASDESADNTVCTEV
jgi:hypothetical protein